MSRTALRDAKPRRDTDDKLFGAVLALSPGSRWRLFDRLVGRPEIAAVGFRISECRLSPRPCAQRDAKWSALHDDGLSYADIARAHSTTRSTVAKAVQRHRRRRDIDSLSTAEGEYHF